MPSTVDILEHPADVGFRAVGPTFEEALDQAVRGLARVETSDRVPEPTDERTVELDADDDESLVVSLLEECVYLVDAEDWLAVGAVVETTDGRPRATLRGAPIVHRDRGVHVKAITWHQLAVARRGDHVEITVFVDI